MSHTDDFVFSIIMAIFNTEKYLKEAIDSVINQSFDFEKNTQLILVNDGSEDNSLEIALDYQKKFPKNILVISQENEGKSSARNCGLSHAKGKYVNFLDSDDSFSQTVLEEVYNFFEKNYDSIDVVTIKLYEFERINKEHPLNFKFENDRVIDLEKDPENPLLSASTSFIKRSAIGNERFKTNLISSEDTNFINRILLGKNAFGVLKNPIYYYRKRYDMSSSSDKIILMKEYFTDRLKYHFMDLINFSLERVGEVPEFLQYTLAYNIQWMFTQDMFNFEREEDKNEFFYYFKKVISHLSIDALSSRKLIQNPIVRNYLISEYNDDLHFELDLKNDDAYVKSKNKILGRLNNHKIWVDIVELKDNFLNISASFTSLFNSENISIQGIRKDKNNETAYYDAKPVDYTSRKGRSFYSKAFQHKINFDLTIPLEAETEYEIGIRVNFHHNGNKEDFTKENTLSKHLKIDFRSDAVFSQYCNFFVEDSRIVSFEDNEIKVENYGFSNALHREFAILKEIKESDASNFMNILALRGLALFIYPVFRFLNKDKETYLFMDRIDKADDNSEHLFRYAIGQKDNVNKYFILSKDTKDYPRLKKEFKNIVNFGSFKHKLLFMLSDKLISSNPETNVINPFAVEGSLKYYSNSNRIPRYYIRHGIAQGNMSNWLRKYDKNLRLLLTSSTFERNSFIDSGYGYEKDRIEVLGLPRFDTLKNEGVKKQILIIPTWRNNLSGEKRIFLESDYFQSLFELLHDEELIGIVEKQGYEIVFKPHPNLERTIEGNDETFIDLFDIPPEIRISREGDYQKLFRQSAIMITDFSSVFFDFAYLRKPIIYYHPNDDHPFRGGYFDYETMGFGEITRNMFDLKSKIKECIEADCQMEKVYEERVDQFFDFIDRDNCKRVYEWIREH